MSGQKDNQELVPAPHADLPSVHAQAPTMVPMWVPGQNSIQYAVPLPVETREYGHARTMHAVDAHDRMGLAEVLLEVLIAQMRHIEVATENKRLNEAAKKPTLLGIPTEVRLRIYSFLFAAARLTYDPQDSITSEGRWDPFRRANMFVNILRVCSQIRSEAIPDLVRNLTIDVNFGDMEFVALLTPFTRRFTRTVYNLNPRAAVDIFSNLREWVWESECIMNERFLERFAALDQRAMFRRALLIYQIYDMASAAFVYQHGGISGKLSLLGKLNLGLCFLIDDDIDRDVLPLGTSACECDYSHESAGNVYLNFVKGTAFFDPRDELGHEACLKRIKSM